LTVVVGAQSPWVGDPIIADAEQIQAGCEGILEQIQNWRADEAPVLKPVASASLTWVPQAHSFTVASTAIMETA
jgi:hypothetical protein